MTSSSSSASSCSSSTMAIATLWDPPPPPTPPPSPLWIHSIAHESTTIVLRDRSGALSRGPDLKALLKQLSEAALRVAQTVNTRRVFSDIAAYLTTPGRIEALDAVDRLVLPVSAMRSVLEQSPYWGLHEQDLAELVQHLTTVGIIALDRFSGVLSFRPGAFAKLTANLLNRTALVGSKLPRSRRSPRRSSVECEPPSAILDRDQLLALVNHSLAYESVPSVLPPQSASKMLTAVSLLELSFELTDGLHLFPGLCPAGLVTWAIAPPLQEQPPSDDTAGVPASRVFAWQLSALPRSLFTRLQV